jgi:hypothetical protein
MEEKKSGSFISVLKKVTVTGGTMPGIKTPFRPPPCGRGSAVLREKENKTLPEVLERFSCYRFLSDEQVAVTLEGRQGKESIIRSWIISGKRDPLSAVESQKHR